MQQPSAVAPTVVAGAGAHSKPPTRRKKRAPSSAQDQQQARIARSASASTAVPFRSCELLEAEYATASVVPARGAAGEQQQHLPPRSPLKTAKVCVPSLEDALDDVQVRFVLNLPEAELSSADRLFFQLEQAWWFYEDHIADAHKHLPHFKLKEFAKLLFQHCEALRPLSGKYNELFEYFRSWKGTIPTAGCILLNAAMTDVVLVKCWKGNSRGLPKGKINQDESAFDAAMREVQEETGYDARGGATEKDFLTVYLNGQQTTMYVVTGVDETFPFEPQVRKEISAIEWFPLDALPKGSYGVEPFVPRLRRWMAKSKGVRAPKNAVTPEVRTQSLLRARKARATSPDVSIAVAAAVSKSQSQPSSPTGTASSSGNASSKKQGRRGSKAVASGGSKAHPGSHSAGGDNVRACSAPSRRGGGGHHPKAKGYDLKNHDTFGGGSSGGGIDGAPGGEGGGVEGWDFEAMLAANERLTGRTFVYDGNPHEFGDPAHAARVSAPAAETVQAHENARGEDLGGQQLKQRKSSKGGGAKNRSRSRGKDRDSAKLNADRCNTGVGGTTALDATSSRGGGGDGGGSLATTTSVSLPATGSGGLCTEETGGPPAVVSMWGDAAVATSSSGGAGVFGDFKFDLRDIMNAAVPQG